MADPQHELMKGIFAKWAATSALSSIDSLHRWEKPPNKSSHPYAVLRDDPATDGGMSCMRQLFSHSVEFRVYHKTPEQAATEAAKIDQVFSSDSLSLTLVNLSLMSCRLIRPSYTQVDDGVWYAGLVYRFQTSRERIA